jgi:hypothetical protein
MMLFISSPPFFRVLRTISKPLLFTRRVTQVPRAVCEIPAANVGIVRQSGEGQRGEGS